MKTYTITYDGHTPNHSSPIPAPERDVIPGDIYEFTREYSTLAGVIYNVGDQVEILDRTTQAPHRRASSQNFVVKCKHFTSVWSNIPWAVAEGRLIFVSSTVERLAASSQPSR